jgi:hypothetical protein
VVALRQPRSLDHMLREIYERNHDEITTDENDQHKRGGDHVRSPLICRAANPLPRFSGCDQIFDVVE